MEKKRIKYSIEYMLSFNIRKNRDVNSIDSYFEVLFDLTKKNMEERIKRITKYPPYQGYEMSSEEPKFNIHPYSGHPSLEFTFIEKDSMFERRKAEEEKQRKIREEVMQKQEELKKKREQMARKEEIAMLRRLAKKYGAQLKIPKDATSNNDTTEPKTRTRRKQTV